MAKNSFVAEVIFKLSKNILGTAILWKRFISIVFVLLFSIVGCSSIWGRKLVGGRVS